MSCLLDIKYGNVNQGTIYLSLESKEDARTEDKNLRIISVFTGMQNH